jgi:hypothetical protein
MSWQKSIVRAVVQNQELQNHIFKVDVACLCFFLIKQLFQAFSFLSLYCINNKLIAILVTYL